MIEANVVVDRLRRTTDTIVGEADLLERLASGRCGSSTASTAPRPTFTSATRSTCG
jgi:hypothetical protein